MNHVGTAWANSWVMGFDERVSEGQVDLIVTTCGINRFFTEHDEPLLTRIGCEWDHHFIRTDTPARAHTVDVVIEGRPEVTTALGGPDRPE